MKALLPPPKLVTRRLGTVLWKRFFLALNTDRNCIMHSLLKPALPPLQRFAMAVMHLLFFEDEDPLLGSAIVVVALPMDTTTPLTLTNLNHTGLTLNKGPTLAKMMGFSVPLIPKVLSLLEGFSVQFVVVMVIMRSIVSTA